MKRTRTCNVCGGTGTLAPAVPSCVVPGKRRPWIVVERCDACEQYSNDLAAAISRYAVAAWVQCRNGGWHALANSRTRRRRGSHPFRNRRANVQAAE